MAASDDSALLATASAAPEASGHCDIVVWEAATGAKRAVLKYHPVGVHSMAFSPDGNLLVAVSSDPDRSVVVWNTLTVELVAASRSLAAIHAVAWLPASEGAPGTFMTAGDAGLLRWRVQDRELACSRLPAPPEGEAAACSALHCGVACFTVADAAGAVWQLPYAPGAPAECSKVAELPGQRITGVAVGEEHAVVATAGAPAAGLPDFVTG